MIRKAILLTVWFPLCVLLLIHNLTVLEMIKTSPSVSRQTDKPVYATPVSESNAIASANSGTGEVLAADIIAGDGRALLLKQFMYGSPMASYAEDIVTQADRYGLDFRLVPAIAMCESNLGRRIPTSDSYNAWGIAVYTGQQEGAKFANWHMAIEWVNQFIYDRFVSQNVIDIKDIGAVWAPPSVENGHSWANCVEGFMRSLM